MSKTQTLNEDAKPVVAQKGKKKAAVTNVHDSIEFRQNLSKFIANARIKKEAEALEKRLRAALIPAIEADNRSEIIVDGKKKLIVDLDDETRVLITESDRIGNVDYSHPDIQALLKGVDIEKYRKEGTTSFAFRETDAYEVDK